MVTPAKGLFSKLRRQQEPEPEPELAPDRLAALRYRAALAEDPELAEFDSSTESADVRQGRSLQPIVLVRSIRDADGGRNAGSSWFGGMPKLGAIPWPRGTDGRPLPFAAQIGLDEIADVRPDSPLPSSGSLAFFIGEGAVVHVPAGVTQFASAPEDLPPAYDEGGYPLPTEPSPLSRTEFRYWPVEPLALSLPPLLRDHGDSGRHDEIRAAMATAIARDVPRPGHGFDASKIPEDVWGGPMPVWWHGVDHLIDHLRMALARAQSGTGGQRDGLAALTGALEGFAAERDPWEPLNSEEQEVFIEALANVWQQFGGLMDSFAPRTVADLTTLSLAAMMAGDDRVFAALPAAVRDLINRDYRLPADSQSQVLGLGASIRNALQEHLSDVLLLQLAGDELMGWRFGKHGAFQFWISPDDLAARNWSAVKLTFEATEPTD